jgi:hypothetical protein
VAAAVAAVVAASKEMAAPVAEMPAAAAAGLLTVAIRAPLRLVAKAVAAKAATAEIKVKPDNPARRSVVAVVARAQLAGPGATRAAAAVIPAVEVEVTLEAAPAASAAAAAGRSEGTTSRPAILAGAAATAGR